MAKKKEKTDSSDSLGSIEDLLKGEFGESIFRSASTILDNPPVIVPFSPSLDVGLGGGIPQGSFIIMTGKPKCGKSVSALHFAAQCQRVLNSRVFFSNVEGRIKKRDLLGINGLDLSPEKFTVIGSTEEKLLTAEDYISVNEKLINSFKNAVFIIDSFSALCTKARYTGEIGERFRDDTPLLLSNFCKRVSNVLPINRSFIIGITHIIANQGNGMSPWAEASGTKIQFASDVKLRCTYNQDVKAGNTIIGQDVNWEIDWSALGPPGAKVKSVLRYGYGLDKEYELIELAKDLGIISVKGHWYYFGEQGCNGIEQARTYLQENPAIFDEINGKVRSMLMLGT